MSVYQMSLRRLISVWFALAVACFSGCNPSVIMSTPQELLPLDEALNGQVINGQV